MALNTAVQYIWYRILHNRYLMTLLISLNWIATVWIIGSRSRTLVYEYIFMRFMRKEHREHRVVSFVSLLVKYCTLLNYLKPEWEERSNPHPLIAGIYVYIWINYIKNICACMYFSIFFFCFSKNEKGRVVERKIYPAPSCIFPTFHTHVFWIPQD